MFDNFLHRLLKKLRTDKETKHKHIVVLMDNATIHKHSSIYETARRFKVNVLLNAQYSPWLNPVEQLFNFIKRALRKANAVDFDDLLGMPLRLIVGAKGLKDGIVELRDRRTKDVSKLKPEDVVGAVAAAAQRLRQL